MYYVFNHSSIGYSHIKSHKPCQDFSSSYIDNERIIVTCSDGHGGSQYIRSQYGSKAAGEAVLNVFKSIDNAFLRKNGKKQLINKIKLLVLCEYNKLIERLISKRPIRKNELTNLKEEEKDILKFNPAKAYGTTLSGAMLYKKKLFIISIGDTEVLGISKGNIIKIFDNSNDPAGNVTYSMCQEDAYQYLRVDILDIKDLDGVVLCTDGLSSPYQSYDNFLNSFIKPMVRRVANTKSICHIYEDVERIASSLGTGDDVSLSFILSDKTKVKYYR